MQSNPHDNNIYSFYNSRFSNNFVVLKEPDPQKYSFRYCWGVIYRTYYLKLFDVHLFSINENECTVHLKCTCKSKGMEQSN